MEHIAYNIIAEIAAALIFIAGFFCGYFVDKKRNK